MASTSPKRGRDYRRVAAQDGIEIFLSRGVRDPRRLEVVVRRFPHRLAVVADGCTIAA